MNINFKNRILPLSLFALFLLGTGNIKVLAQYNNGYNNGYNDNNSYQIFYDDLAPYGQWLQDPQYGYVWLPNVGRGFRPYYSNGHWAMTEYGNMWVSNYSWGWAPFHYGRWILSDYYGWAWVPGSEWGPAWVTWRQGGGYYGWAPMMPGISINISFGNSYYVPQNYWTFIPYHQIYTSNFHRYNSPRRSINIYRNTTVINNTYVDNRTRNTYVTGPRRSEVRSTIGKDVSEYQVSPRRSAGVPSVRGANIEVYRPTINETNSRTAAPREVKTVKQPIAPSNNSTQRNANESMNAQAPVRTMNVTEPKNQTQSPQNVRDVNTTNQRNLNNQPQQRSTVQPQVAPVRAVPQQAPNGDNRSPAINRRTEPAPVQRASSVPQKAPVQRQTSVREQKQAPAVERKSAPTRQVAPVREVRKTEDQPSRAVQQRGSSR